MADRQYHLKFSGDKAAAVDAYLEYKRIVGDDDGGTMFTPAQYEEYCKNVVPKRMKNRLFVSWTASSGMDCKMIGPETPCFCQHRYKQHKTDFDEVPSNPKDRHLPCRAKGCKCAGYHYVPTMSGRPIRCTCKHTSEEHSEKAPFICAKNICQKCPGFKSSFTCGCGESYMNHKMVVETKAEREERGHPVGMDTPYAAMGGLTGFSSLAEGYERLDPSGRGAPSDEFLQQQITSSDHAYIRGHVPSIQAYRRQQKDYDQLGTDLPERMSALNVQQDPGTGYTGGRDEAADMAYFERRYQERQKAERAGKRGIVLEADYRPRTGNRKTASSTTAGTKKTKAAGRGGPPK